MPTPAQIISKYPRPRSALLPLLHLVQSEEGYVSADGIAYCAAKFGLTEAEVTAVVSFYTMYKRRPVGDYHVGVCTNTLCAVMGGDQIFAELAEHLGVGNDETTPDGKVIARARGVQRRLRLRPGRDGQLGVLRQHDPGLGQAARRRPAGREPGQPHPGPGPAVHLARGVPDPGRLRRRPGHRGPVGRARPAWSASSWPRSAAGPRPGPRHVSGDADPLAGAGRTAGPGPTGSGVSHADSANPRPGPAVGKE